MSAFRVAKYLIRTALRSFRYAWKLHLISMSTLAIATFLVGSLLVTLRGLQTMLTGSHGQSHISVYFKEGEEKAYSVEKPSVICAKPFVQRCIFVSKEEAMKQFLREHTDLKTSVEALAKNPFPASIEIEFRSTFRDRNAFRLVAEQAKIMPGVEYVDSGGEWADRWLELLNFFDRAVRIVAVIFLAALVFVVANTVQLIVYSRRDEVQILDLVGATPGVIRLPFVLEGAFQGLLGGLVGVLFLRLGFFFVRSEVQIEILAPIFRGPTIQLMVQLVLGSVVAGLLGSFFSVRRFISA